MSCAGSQRPEEEGVDIRGPAERVDRAGPNNGRGAIPAVKSDDARGGIWGETEKTYDRMLILLINK